MFEGVRRRDPEALGRVFDHLGPIVHEALSRVEPDAGRVDRLVEDVFWELWVSAGQPGGETDPYRLVLGALGSRLAAPSTSRARSSGSWA